MSDTRRPSGARRMVGLGLWSLGALAGAAMAQGAQAGGIDAGELAGGVEADQLGLWALFRQSFDIFTVVLVVGSVAAVALIVRNVIEVRAGVIMPRKRTGRLIDLIEHGRFEDARAMVKRDDTFVGSVVRAAMRESGRGRAAMREAAELAASDQSARWFRKIELLNIIGNLGPLVGLAGTVWGMIIAFTSLGAADGQAGPADLSLGISKALFHTLLGLVLAIPCLLTFGIYRGIVDRICTRAMVESARLVELLPAGENKKDA